MNLPGLLDSHHAFWRSAFWPVLAGVIMLVGTLVLWRSETQHQEARFNAHFESQALARATVIQRELKNINYVVIALSGLFNASQHVSRQEFGRMMADYLQSNPSILSARWLPRVALDQRARMEADAGLANFEIRDRDAKGGLIRAGNRSLYFPIYYMHPQGEYRGHLGFDAYSDPLRRVAMDRARDSGEIAATAGYVYADDPEQAPHIIVYRALYEGGIRPGAIQQRRALLTGFVSVQIRIPDLIGHALSGLPVVGLNYLIVDGAPLGSSGLRLLYSHAARVNAPISVTEESILKSPFRRMNLNVPGRQWQMLVAPAPVFYENIGKQNAHLVLVAGLIISLLTALYLRANQRSLVLLHTDAYHDTLTGLPNRKLLNVRLEHALKYASRSKSPLAVFYLDLDGFKQVNDQHGHAAGDTLLREVAQRLQNTLRASDTIARLGGDEFVVLAEDLGNASDAAHLANKILAALAAPYSVPKRAHISASIGICLCERQKQDANELLDRADKALYRAKQKGRNCFQFDSETEMGTT